MIRTIRRVAFDKYAVSNKIVWFDTFLDEEHPDAPFGGTVDISRAEYPNYDNYTQIVSGYSANNKYYIDRNIAMNTQYKYRVFVDDLQLVQEDLSGTWISHLTSYKPLINNTRVGYDYKNNILTVMWDFIGNDDFEPNTVAVKNYKVYICKKNINNDLILFETADLYTNYFSINGSATGIGPNGSVTFNIENGLYYFYITPVLRNFTEDPPLDYSLNTNAFTFGGTFAEPNAKFTLSPETPSDFKITSPYTNGKISFSWKSTNPTPNQYILTITNTSTSTTTTININTTNYTLDNSDLTSSNALQPGFYTVSISASYNNTIQSLPSSNLTFTIPVTKIFFTKKFIDSQGQITTNKKNGVAGIQLDWNKLGYATYYKINVKQYNKDLQYQSQDDLVYHVAGSINSIQFAWNFPNEKSVFEFNMSYTTDSISPPDIESLDALGESYLGDDNTNYNVLFNSSGGSGGGIIGQVPIPEGG